MLCTGSQMALCLLLGQKQTGGFDYIIHAHLSPGNIGRIPLCKYGNLLPVYHNGILGAGNLALEPAMHGVIFQHVSQIRRLTQIIDSHNLNLGIIHAGAECHPPNSTKTIDTNLNGIPSTS